MTVDEIIGSDVLRRSLFPVVSRGAFMAHAGVAPLTHAAAEALRAFAANGESDNQENAWAVHRAEQARSSAARLLGCDATEVALLGPTSLGLNLVAHGIPWREGDEVVFYPDDYPANPWANLAGRGVVPVPVRVEHPGVVTKEAVEAVLTSRTRLVALASCHFLSGYRIDVDGIGAMLQARGILFSLDAIQTLGAFPLSVRHVDFLSADSHKWLLGPVGAGVFYVKAERQDLLRPALLGSWNVVSPQFVAQETIRFHPGARRYEPGTFNVPGIMGMGASMDVLLDVGVDAIAARLLHLRRHLVAGVQGLGYRLFAEEPGRVPGGSDARRSAIVAITRPGTDMREVAHRLSGAGIQVSLRQNRSGEAFVRFSPHFYNTGEEVDRALSVLSEKKL
jgi:cysteine desulfurase/selenocysteine lyase